MAKNSAVKPARVVTLRARAVAKTAANVIASGGVSSDKTKLSSYRKINGLSPKGNRPKLKTRNGSRCIFCSKFPIPISFEEAYETTNTHSPFWRRLVFFDGIQ
jgi:hypothetical protein